MKVLHILKSEPDETTKTLVKKLSERDTTIFHLFDEQANFEELIDLIFENDKVISWW